MYALYRAAEYDWVLLWEGRPLCSSRSMPIVVDGGLRVRGVLWFPCVIAGPLQSLMRPSTDHRRTNRVRCISRLRDTYVPYLLLIGADNEWPGTELKLTRKWLCSVRMSEYFSFSRLSKLNFRWREFNQLIARPRDSPNNGCLVLNGSATTYRPLVSRFTFLRKCSHSSSSGERFLDDVPSSTSQNLVKSCCRSETKQVTVGVRLLLTLPPMIHPRRVFLQNQICFFSW